MKDSESMWRVRGMLANHSMIELMDKTRKLADKFGYDGAEDYLRTQLKFLRDMREADNIYGEAF